MVIFNVIVISLISNLVDILKLINYNCTLFFVEWSLQTIKVKNIFFFS